MPSSYAVGEHFERFIKNQVAQGRYASASEVVRDALRLLEEVEQRRTAALETLREEIRTGLASGEGKSADEVLARLEGKYTRLAERE
jgi:antitoxin ParD1/3/4